MGQWPTVFEIDFHWFLREKLRLVSVKQSANTFRREGCFTVDDILSYVWASQSVRSLIKTYLQWNKSNRDWEKEITPKMSKREREIEKAAKWDSKWKKKETKWL